MKRWAVILFAAFLLCSTVAKAEYREFEFYPFTYKVPADWTYEAEGDDNEHSNPTDSASLNISVEDISFVLSVETPEEFMSGIFEGMYPGFKPVYDTRDNMIVGTVSKEMRLGRRNEIASVTMAVYDGIMLSALFYGTTEANSNELDEFLAAFPESIKPIQVK